MYKKNLDLKLLYRFISGSIKISFCTGRYRGSLILTRYLYIFKCYVRILVLVCGSYFDVFVRILVLVCGSYCDVFVRILVLVCGSYLMCSFVFLCWCVVVTPSQ
jgi:hypothetical protein